MSESDDNTTLTLSSPSEDKDGNDNHDMYEDDLYCDNETVLLDSDNDYNAVLHIDEGIGLMWWSSYYWTYT
eukprot:7296753-Ditylum_brightwellii.AAC.1